VCRGRLKYGEWKIVYISLSSQDGHLRIKVGKRQASCPTCSYPQQLIGSALIPKTPSGKYGGWTCPRQCVYPISPRGHASVPRIVNTEVMVVLGYDCGANNPCWTANEGSNFPHVNPTMYITCGIGSQCSETPCPVNTIWNQEMSACVIDPI